MDGNGGTKRFLYGQGVVPLAEYNGSIWITNQVANGRIMGRTYNASTGGGYTKKEYLHTDAIGNVIGISLDSSAVTYKAEYDPFGEILAQEGMSEPDYTFIGAYGVRKLGAMKKLMGASRGGALKRGGMTPSGGDPSTRRRPRC